jgi:hypothetical protein
MDLEIAPMEAGDWEVVRTIYGEGIATGNATFETTPPEWDEWNRNHLRACRLAARSGRGVVGWGALSPVSSRCVYGCVVTGPGHRQGFAAGCTGRIIDPFWNQPWQMYYSSQDKVRTCAPAANLCYTVADVRNRASKRGCRDRFLVRDPLGAGLGRGKLPHASESPNPIH